MMIKRIVLQLSMFFIFAGYVFADNIGNYVYGVYSEVFPGVNWSGGTEDSIYFTDEYFTGTVTDGTTNPVDGEKYFHMEATAAGSAFIGFVSFQSRGYRDMSDYYNGEIEFWVRSSTPNAGNFINVGYKQTGNIERVLSISELKNLGFTAFEADGNWYKVIIPLKGSTFDILDIAIELGLATVELPLLININGPITFDIDHVVWRISSLDSGGNDNIGKNPYAIYSESYPGAYTSADNNDRIALRSPTSVTVMADNTAWEGVEYFRTVALNSTWGYEFVDSSDAFVERDMTPYYGGSLEFNIRVPAASTNYNSIKIGVIANGWNFWVENTLTDLGVTNDNQWHKVSIPLTNDSFDGAFGTSQIQAIRRLFNMENKTNASVDIDNIVWVPYEQLPLQIGNDNYGIYSEAIPGASFYAANNDRIFKAQWSAGNGSIITSASSYEGSTYYESVANSASGNWGLHFSSANNAINAQNMRDYYNGSLEMYIRISTASTNYSNIRVGVQAGEQKTRTLADLGYKPNGRWKRVIVPLDSTLQNLSEANLGGNTQYVFFSITDGSDSYDVDHIVWRKTASEPFGNKENDVYGIYSDWIPGVNFSTASSVDYVALFPWSENPDTGPVGTTDGTAFEGSNYFKSPANGGWGIFFVDSGKQATVRSMSEFYDGVLEFYVRGTANTSIGNATVGFNTNDTDYIKTLSSLGINTATGDWQKVSIPLNSASFAGLDRAILLETVKVLFMMNNEGSVIDVDYIVWKKYNPAVPSANVELTLKNRTDNAESDDHIIKWDSDMILSPGEKEVAASQYLEVQLSDWFQSDVTWGLQIYTNNDIAEVKYTGEMTTNTVSGLVSAERTGVYLPMRWRASDLLFPLPEPEDPDNKILTWENAWSAFRDKTADSFYFNRAEEIIFCDRRGFKYAHTNDFGQLGYGALNAEKTFYIYFSAYFNNSARGYIYKNDAIIIELFYE